MWYIYIHVGVQACNVPGQCIHASDVESRRREIDMRGNEDEGGGYGFIFFCLCLKLREVVY